MSTQPPQDMTLGAFIEALRVDEYGNVRDPDHIVRFHTVVDQDLKVLSVYSDGDGFINIDIDVGDSL